MYGWKPVGCPLIIVAWLWVFWSKESTLSVLRIGGEMGRGRVGCRGAGGARLFLFQFHGPYWYPVPVLVGADKGMSRALELCSGGKTSASGVD